MKRAARAWVVGMAALALALNTACRRERAPQASLLASADAPAASSAPSAPEERRTSHGVWLWKTRALLGEQGAAESIAAECRAAGINEIYVSVSEDRLADPRMPAFLATLRAAGLRLEALMGEASWYQPAMRPQMLAAIDAVAAFNAAHRETRFAAIHLDVEPHQLAINKGAENRAFVPDLIESLRAARARAAESGMSLSADVPRKLLLGSVDERKALTAAAPRLFLMLYELRHRAAEEARAGEELGRTSAELVRAAYEGAGDASGQIVVGVSVEDYGERLRAMLGAVDGANRAEARYGGWAIHDFAQLAAARPSRALRAIPGARLCVTSGRVSAIGPSASRVSVGGMRGVVAGDASRVAELAFTYRGASQTVEPLASGEVRKQIGLKLSAKNTCNVVYVMWHIEPTAGIFVSVKHNPGKSTHAECGASGYINVRPRSGAPPAPLRAGEPHTLRAEIQGDVLRVSVDGAGAGAVAWEGPLPAEAFTFDGPVGVRSDNGEFDFEIRVPEGGPQGGECPPKGAE